MKRTDEFEIKLDAPDGFVLPELPGTAIEPRTFTSTYYDTPDFRLARARITLRRRVEHGASLWQLKLPQGDERLELEVAGPPGEPPNELTDLVVAVCRGRRLDEIAELRTRRSGVRVDLGGGPAADVTIDDVSVMDSRRVEQTFSEVEIERLDGRTRDVRRIAKRLRRAGAVPGESEPKLFRLLVLAEDPVKTGTGPIGLEHVRAYLRAQYDEILANDPRIRVGGDADAVHDMRVAARRSRALLRVLRARLEREWGDSLRADLKWLGQELGTVRDLDVFGQRLADDAESLDADRRGVARLAKRVERDSRAARAKLLERLASDRYFALLDSLESAVESPRVLDPDVDVVRVARKSFNKVRRLVSDLGDSPSDEALHELRIKAKRARYAAELAEPAAGRKARRFVSAAKAFQDVAGAHQDAVVAEERLRESVAEKPDNELALAVGRLIERQRAQRKRARAELPRAWRKVQKRALKS